MQEKEGEKEEEDEEEVEEVEEKEGEKEKEDEEKEKEEEDDDEEVEEAEEEQEEDDGVFSWFVHIPVICMFPSSLNLLATFSVNMFIGFICASTQVLFKFLPLFVYVRFCTGILFILVLRFGTNIRSTYDLFIFGHDRR